MIDNLESYYAKGCGRCKHFDTPDCSVKFWAEGVSDLRAICQKTGMEETLKWGHPCFVHAGRNIAIIGAFRSDFRLTYVDASLLENTKGLLEKTNSNSTSEPYLIRFTDVQKPKSIEADILDLLKQAMDFAERGIKPKKSVQKMPLPDELQQALDADSELNKAYFALTPGRQRSYIINLNQAKKAETRFARIEKFRQKIIEGKGALEP